jgi:hypothetical protein
VDLCTAQCWEFFRQKLLQANSRASVALNRPHDSTQASVSQAPTATAAVAEDRMLRVTKLTRGNRLNS